MDQDKVSRLSDAGKSLGDEGSDRGSTMQQESFGQRWAKIQPTKKVVFWFSLASIVLTMIIGFNWGGWVTGGTADRMAQATAKDAVVERLASVCVGQFNQDPGKEQKLTELNEAKAYERDDYVRDHGWATMPGEEKPDSKVADACAKLLVQISQ